jgi:rod shape-determining protein MreD
MRLSIAFFIALFIALFGSAIFPGIRLFAFAPFLTLVFTRKNLYTSLWLSLSCGLIIDLLQNQYTFGLYALCYSLTTLILYKQKRLIYADKPFSLSIFVAIYSMTAVIVHLIIIAFCGATAPRSFMWILCDTLLMVVIDSAYALILFTLPTLGYVSLKKKILLMKAAKEE